MKCSDSAPEVGLRLLRSRRGGEIDRTQFAQFRWLCLCLSGRCRSRSWLELLCVCAGSKGCHHECD
ncbi:hypothetical protein [Fischerella sp. PCC 9605]|uniref:hypothetical protein n=1 Tax=Fischerella sp. PCC 9605 TaxID=1173024 RepID=UPI0012DF75EE|nr:hypothetical protein [Fischerella sp. PCC 9605]